VGRPVNPVIRTAGMWHAAEDPQVKQIKASPSVTVLEPADIAGKRRPASE
jgi:hypothetical protein